MVHERPDGLPDPEDDSEAAAEQMRAAFRGRVEELLSYHGSVSCSRVAVQGEISSMKTWVIAFTAERALEQGNAVTVLVPQKVNREDVVKRLRWLGIPYIEQPSRIDLCSWDPWRDKVGHVSEAVCSSNGCEMFPGSDGLEGVARDVLGRHKMLHGSSLRLDRETVADLSSRLDEPTCPFYLLEALNDVVGSTDAVRVATTAKAFANEKGDGFNDADVVLLDEAHTVAADTSLVMEAVDLDEVIEACRKVSGTVERLTAARRFDALAVGGLGDEIAEWRSAAGDDNLNLDDLFDRHPDILNGGFRAVDDVRGWLLEEASRRTRSGSWSEASDATEAQQSLATVNEFLVQLSLWRKGERDFVHVLHEAGGGSINRTYFRRTDDRQQLVTPQSVHRAWETEGTNSVIDKRLGGLLDTHLPGVWEGREVSPGGSRPKPMRRPLDLLQEIMGAETLIGLSATHNEVSDPSREPDDFRSTRNDLVVAPLQLRSADDEGAEYHGKDAVSPDTPWFQELVEETKQRTGAKLAAVPINGRNEAKWETVATRTLSVPDGRGGSRETNGLVPNSRAAIGSKNLESLDVSTALCGLQVQSPGSTACRLIALWEMVAPDHERPEEALERCWRLLAQQAVAGTIQAGGRFGSDVTNLVFDHEGMLELAGFEYEVATPNTPGFPGAFVERFEEARQKWETTRDVNQVCRTVKHLAKSAGKSPTPRQYLSTYQQVYAGTDEEDAKKAVEAAVDAGRVRVAGDRLRLRASKASR
ncbi:hypothetical protein HSB1_10620 [Halogranum salarium B-1]|uniref:Uncharacterized protein n=1 Tax=Halogranum salarium B-1 TaxID=1210908 RepID=J3JGV5_9EURY|nr:hypothetical protein HSB1_10620 [Halogranum salarium B-1]